MDFSLREKDISFSLQRYLETIERTLGSYNLNVDVSMKEKRRLSPVQSAFVKGNTLTHLMQISAPKELLQKTPSNELLKIKLEIDTDPPEGASYEQKYILFPQPCELSLYDIPSLFAGKLHALLCRNWGNRIKGRDFYDYIWYLSQGYSVHIKHLEQRMRQSGHWEEDAPLTHARLKDLLIQRFETVDIEEAKSDVLPFISSEKVLDVWSRDFFITITKDRLKTDLK